MSMSNWARRIEDLYLSMALCDDDDDRDTATDRLCAEVAMWMRSQPYAISITGHEHGATLSISDCETEHSSALQATIHVARNHVLGLE